MLQKPHDLLLATIYSERFHVDIVHRLEVHLRERLIGAGADFVDEARQRVLGDDNLVD